MGRKRVRKVGPVHIFRCLFLIDTVYVMLILEKYVQFGFHIPYDHISIVFCKMNRYFNFSLDAISPMLVVYIVVDRYLSIKSSNKILRRTDLQVAFFITVFIFNALLYAPVAIFEGNNSQNVTAEFHCGFVSSSAQFAISLYDFVNLVGLPIGLMLTFNLLLIHAIFKTRQRIAASQNQRQNDKIKQDIRFAITSVSMNVMFLILNMPLAIIDFSTSFSNFIFILCLYIFFCNYSINFYVILFSNRLVRSELLTMFSTRTEQALTSPIHKTTN